MEIEHFLAMLPLFGFFLISMIWFKRGLIHLILIAYSIILAIIAASNGWEFFFWPVCAGGAIIGLILFAIAMSRGELI